MDDSCATRYPLLLLHGVKGRDDGRHGYWGRIPAALRAQGAVIYHGNQDALGTIEQNAAFLARRLAQILQQSGCQKVNIIAHSKGGLEARYLVSTLGMAGAVASITTICTPHHGSQTMDKLLRLPKPLFGLIGGLANGFFRLAGDEQPNFSAVCSQFSTAYLVAFNKQVPDAPGVYYQSYAAVMRRPTQDMLLSIPGAVVRSIEGDNDGFLPPSAMRWGVFRGTWQGGRRGVSHIDAVDFRRRPFRSSPSPEPGAVSDICNAYVNLVADLARMGF